MKLKTKLLLLFLAYITFPAQSQNISYAEYSAKLDSVTKLEFQRDSLFAFAHIDSPGMPEDWYAILTIDTINGVLIRATSYIYEGKFKYLTNYHYWNNKLTSTNTYKMLIKNQSSEKYINWERNCSYWNDSLISSSATDNQPFDYKREIRIANEISQKFIAIYGHQKLYFTKGSNMGHFKKL